jgi:uncharacterized membrane protein
LIDGVFAIAITLLAIDLRLPVASESFHGAELFRSLLAVSPKVFSYAISFGVLAVSWSGNHRLFRYIQRCNGRLVWLTLVYLFCIAFLPFPTAVLGAHLGDPVAEMFYASTLVVLGLSSWAVWWYATDRHRLVALTLDRRVIRHYHRILLGIISMFLLIMLLLRSPATRIVGEILAYLFAASYIVLAILDWKEPT